MITSQLHKQLNTLTGLLKRLTDDQFTCSIKHLGEATIGGHSRHIIEIIQCVLNGYEPGRVNYIHRHRNVSLENNRMLAIETIYDLLQQIDKPDKVLELYTETDDGLSMIYPYSTYLREIIYSTEHTVHHLALIKVGLTELDLDLVENTFGVAYSTLVHRQAIAG